MSSTEAADTGTVSASSSVSVQSQDTYVSREAF